MWTYGGEDVMVKDIAQTSDDGFVIALDYAASDTVMVVKVDENGELLWTRRYGNTSYLNGIQSIAALGTQFVFVGSSTGPSSAGLRDGWVVICNSNGTVDHRHNYGGSLGDYFHKVRVVDGNIIVVGVTYSHGPATSNGWAMKLACLMRHVPKEAA